MPYKYHMGYTEIEEGNYEKYLGVYVDSEMSSSRQCGEAIKKANKMLGYIVISVEFKSKKVILTLKCISKTSSRILCSVLVTSLQKRYCCSRKGAKKSNQNYPGFKSMSYAGRLK